MNGEFINERMGWRFSIQGTREDPANIFSVICQEVPAASGQRTDTGMGHTQISNV